jgi:hypothetical protein
MTESVSSHDPQGAPGQDELIVGKPLVVKLLWLWLSQSVESCCSWGREQFGNPEEASAEQRLVKKNKI